jgi:hypothetical protein
VLGWLSFGHCDNGHVGEYCPPYDGQMQIRTGLVSCGLVVGLTILGGCSSADSDSSGTSASSLPSATEASLPTPTQLCDKVSSDAIQAIVGTVPPQAQTGTANGMSMCQWEGDQDYELAVSAGTTSALALAIKTIEASSSQPVDGMGDKAFIATGYSTAVTGSSGGATLYIVDGPTTYYVAGIENGQPPSNSELETVGSQVIG